METIRGADAMAAAEAISKAGGTFTIAFYSYSRRRGEASDKLKTYTGCRMRKPMPHDKLTVDGVHYFLFDTEDQEPKMCYKVLIRYIGFPQDNFKLKKVIWYE